MDAATPDRAGAATRPSPGAEAAGRPAASRGGDALRRVPRRRADPAAAVPRRRRRPAATTIRRSPTAAAAAIELLHCASLVHDDLPCFDDAATRRGKPSVHRAFGEPLAVLTGDALIVLAFETLARAAHAPPDAPGAADAHRQPRRRACPAASSAGQAWECEPHVDAGRLPAGQDRRAVRRRDDGRRRRRRAPIPRRGATLGERSARPTRSPTTSATSPATPTNSASRSAGTRRWAARARRANSASRARSPVSSIWLTGAIASIPPCPGAAELRASMLIETRALPAQGTRAARGLTREGGRDVRPSLPAALRAPARALRRLARPAAAQLRASSAGRRPFR